MALLPRMRRPVGILAAFAALGLASCTAPTTRPAIPPGGDASGLGVVAIGRVEAVPGTVPAAEARIGELIREAAASGLPVSIAGARHTMGGQTAYPRAIVLDMTPLKTMELLADGETLRVGAGARWADVIPFLDARARSVAIMQSNNDFTVGGSLGANCHGWQVNRPPMVDSVKALRVVRASGEAVRCSREEDADLFRHVIGGYGMFGVVTEADLDTVPNRAYEVDSQTILASEFDDAWRESVDGHPDVEMAYGRLAISDGRLLSEALLTTFTVAPSEDIPLLHEFGGVRDWAKRTAVLMGSDFDFGRALRWALETELGEALDESVVSRNNLQNEPTTIYAETDPARTDVLQEYFLPRANLGEFLRLAAPPIRRRHANVLNVTVRFIAADTQTALPYARVDSFAVVMFYNFPKDEADEYAALTRELIDCATVCGGTYYLPYRLDARRRQILKAYPMAKEFLAAKDAEDPGRVFRNGLEAFLRGEDPAPAPPRGPSTRRR